MSRLFGAERLSVIICVVIAAAEDTRNALAALLRPLGVETFLLPSATELVPLLRESPVSGILIGVNTAIKATPQEKTIIQDMSNLYPFAKFKLSESGVLVMGRAKTLEDFAAECQKFPPRTLRREIRKTVYRALLLSARPDFEDAEKSVTVNLSEGGCFAYTTRQWQSGDRAWVRFLNSGQQRSGIVRAWVPWGNDRIIPGIGIEFDPLPDTISGNN